MYTGQDALKAIDESLEALDMSYVDLLQIHWPGNVGLLGDTDFMSARPDLQENVKAVASALNSAKQNGKVRHIGLCNFGEDDLNGWLAAGGPHPVSNQLPYNLLWRVGERGALPASAQAGIGVMAYSPLQQGLLNGRVRTPADLPEGRRRIRLFGASASTKARHNDSGAAEAESAVFGKDGALEKLHGVCAGSSPEIKLPALALAWLLSRSGVSCVIVGASSPEQAARNASLPNVPSSLLEKATEATDALKRTLGPCLDQYAAESRIHGNGENTSRDRKRKALDAP